MPPIGRERVPQFLTVTGVLEDVWGHACFIAMLTTPRCSSRSSTLSPMHHPPVHPRRTASAREARARTGRTTSSSPAMSGAVP